ncbi:helicase-related protein [Tenacibaculum maritimum]|uniref:helicase-related protein n=1 Tax=Tenacibaculum maritimum TaxID=107401 RepID=UPI0012E67296|nr:helicase-related protein [Tenacibaculum maritimum]CAA0225813.1 putative helicase [Tenacibaculum maritimum]
MILDNENKNLKVHEWISKYTEEGKFDIVTGYFTIGALAHLSKEVNDKISDFRLVLGDIVSIDIEENRPLDLLNENITIEAALKLNRLSQEVVSFLKQDKVIAKTLEPNFCHAKNFLFNPSENDDRNKYFISGSSNLTEAGIGLNHTNNIELNIAETGNNSQFKELVDWFETLWTKPQAHTKKTILKSDGSKEKIDFKQYLIDEIEKIFIKYTPREIYYKVLFELFGNQILEDENDPEFNRQVGRLENSVVYNTLYEFQKKGVLSLIKMLQRYNGAILADAVGLGKTWSALAVIKFFQLQGREILLLCPKKLEHNWKRYKKHQDSKFEKDQFDFFVRFHSDMMDERLEKYDDRADSFFNNDKPKLIVIDESHNLRNDKSNRYKFLLEQVIKPNDDIKVLLLSATPINNSLNDIRNQFKLMVQGDVHGYSENLNVRNIDGSFRTAQKAFNEWRENIEPKIGEFVKKLPAEFFTLTDALIVARTRKMIEGQQRELVFPKKEKPINLFVTPSQLGNFESFEELFEHFPPMLSGYQPSFYLEEEEERDVLHDERQRDRFLVKMLYILMVKRLESSWLSLFSTVEKIRDHHQNALDKIKAYQADKKKTTVAENETDLFEGDEFENDYEEFTLGKKRKISLADIDAAKNLNKYKKDLKKDLDALDNLFTNLQKFETKINNEIIKPNNHKSVDNKLEELIRQINSKRLSDENNNNQKVVIFTVYRDTAQYLFEQLKARGFNKLAFVSGSGSKTTYSDEETKKFEPILERFAPYTKLFKEKEWAFESNQTGIEAYNEWINWLNDNDQKTYKKLQNPIDILIATDTLSEGQNLQDADMVINYDIHWNPVRIIQRMGRIDRLGSPNNKIFGINFWPSNNINSYLDLQGRIEQRMAAMKLAGVEVDHQFSDSFKEMIQEENKEESLDQKMKNKMLEQMQVTFDDLDGEESFGFDDLSLERYRQDLLEEFNRDKAKYQLMPKGVYTGFKANADICTDNGIIALMGYPAKPPNTKEHNYKAFDLVYIDKKGELVLLNQKEVLDALTHHKDKPRFVPNAIDKGEETAIKELVSSMQSWLKNQAVIIEEQEDGSSKKVMGTEAKDVLAKLRRGSKDAIKRIKENKNVGEKYQLENFDLITWFLVTV